MNKRKLTVVAGTALCALSACLAFAACGGNDHTVKEIKAKDATCTEAGNEHYYMCTDEGCGKYFSDADCKHEIKLEDVVKPALGHDPQKVEAEGATCTTDGHETYYDCSRCELNFADAAGTQILADEDIFIAKYDHDQLREVQKTAPTLQEDGNVYHWHCDRCEKDFTNDNANKEIEDVVIPKLVKETGLTINVATYDNATAEGTAPTGTFALKGTEYPDSDTEGVSIANGKLSVTELIPDSYKFEIEGYYPVYFTVEKGVKEYNLDLYKHFHTHTVDNDNGRMSYDYLDGDLKLHYNNADFNGDTPLVHFADSHITGNNYMAQFTLSYNMQPAYWTSRITIRLGSSNDGNKFVGIMFFPTSDDVHVNDYVVGDPGMGDDTNWNRSPFQIKGTQGTAVNAALLGDGLQVRAMRSGNVLYIRFLINGEWVKVWERNVEGLGTDFAISASCPGSTFTVSDMKYFDYEVMSQTHFGYFYEGTGDDKIIYSSFDAGETTLDAMEIKKQTVTVNIEVYDGLRNKIDVPEGLKLTLTDSYDRDTIENATIENGVLTATQFLPGRYLVSSISGYYAVDTIYIDVDTTTYTIKLYQIDSRFEVDGNDMRVTAEEVGDELQFKFNNVGFDGNISILNLKDEAISGTNYMTEFTIQYNVTGWSWMERFAIRLGTSSDQGKFLGLMMFATGSSNDGFKCNEVIGSDRNLGDGNNGGRAPFAIKGAQQTAIENALKGDGLQIRALRVGNKLTVCVFINNTWEKIWEKSVEGLGTGISIMASGPSCTATVSNISFGTFVAETNEKYAHFIKDGAYITANGDNTTLDGLDIKKFENLTVNVIVYDQEGDGKQEVAAPTVAFNLYNEVARFNEEGVTISEGKLSATALYPGKYVIMIDGYKPVTFTVTEDTTEYNLALYVHDRANNVSVDEETGDITYNNPWGSGVVTTLKDDIAGENYMTEFTLKYQFTEGKNWGWTERFSVILGMSPVDEKPIGFMFFMEGDDAIKGSNAIINDIGGFGENHEGCKPFANGSADTAAINTALKGDGLKVRGVRNGNKLTVYFLIGTDWKPAWEKTVEGLSAYMGVTAAHNNSTLTVSGITFGEYVEATDSVAAHLVVGTGETAKVYTLDGVETTLEDLAITE